jgi:hypothetical protein
MYTAPLFKNTGCGNVDEKFGIGVIFLGTEERIRDKRRNPDTPVHVNE